MLSKYYKCKEDVALTAKQLDMTEEEVQASLNQVKINTGLDVSDNEDNFLSFISLLSPRRSWRTTRESNAAVSPDRDRSRAEHQNVKYSPGYPLYSRVSGVFFASEQRARSVLARRSWHVAKRQWRLFHQKTKNGV